MAKEDTTVSIGIIAFGPIAERLGGRKHPQSPNGCTVRELVLKHGLGEWISFGLSVAINGNRCAIDTVLEKGEKSPSSTGERWLTCQRTPRRQAFNNGKHKRVMRKDHGGWIGTA